MYRNNYKWKGFQRGELGTRGISRIFNFSCSVLVVIKILDYDITSTRIEYTMDTRSVLPCPVNIKPFNFLFKPQATWQYRLLELWLYEGEELLVSSNHLSLLSGSLWPDLDNIVWAGLKWSVLFYPTDSVSPSKMICLLSLFVQASYVLDCFMNSPSKAVTIYLNFRTSHKHCKKIATLFKFCYHTTLNTT